MTIEAIDVGDEEEDGDASETGHDDQETTEDYYDENDDERGEADDRRSLSLGSNKSLRRRLSRRRAVGVHQRQQPSAATVHMRHQASGVLFVWRTAGVKTTCGAELHEGGAYRLVASVRDVPDAARRQVAVTRCRLTVVTDLCLHNSPPTNR